jgi:hypothetical protein
MNPDRSSKASVKDGAGSQAYSYDSPHDTAEYARSLEKFITLQEEEGSNPPSLILAMTIGINGLDHVLKSPPFSDLTSKSLQESYIPINDVLKKEILRRSHFLLKEIDNKKTDHPLRDNSMRLRMPQPAQWTREKRVKFLEEKNMLELHPLDVAFLKAKVDEIKEEVGRVLMTPGANAKSSRRQSAAGSAEGAHSDRSAAAESGLSKMIRGMGEAAAAAGPSSSTTWQGRGSRGRRGRVQEDFDDGSGGDDGDGSTSNHLCNNVATRLYGIANGSSSLFGLSEVDASAALEYLINNRREASSFLKVGHDFYKKSGDLSFEELLDKSIHDLVKFHQRKRIKPSDPAVSASAAGPHLDSSSGPPSAPSPAHPEVAV